MPILLNINILPQVQLYTSTSSELYSCKYKFILLHLQSCTPASVKFCRVLITTIVLFAIGFCGYSQTVYSLKAESGFMKFSYNSVTIEPGPNWKGYYLRNQNGFELNIINGIKCKEKFFAGIGVGYLNFEGINGVSLLSDFEYLLLKYRLTPLAGLKLGYSHIWNQYEGGTGTASAELGFGCNFRLNENLGIYVKTGFLFTQQSQFVPIRMGFRF